MLRWVPARLGLPCVFFFLLLFSLSGIAQTQPADTPPTKIPWQQGPLKGKLGNVAEIEVPAGYLFADGDAARRILELNHNPTSGEEVGVIAPADKNLDWIVFFEFHESGYVTDSDKVKLDADALLKSIKDGTEEANKVRQERGWSPFHITGWARQPFYDEKTHNLTWAIVGKDEKTDNGETVNYSTRILGRKGSMNVDLVLAPNQLNAVVPSFNGLLSDFKYTSGNRYADFVKGDKVAGYGLTALIAGGAAAAAVKTGLFAKLLKLLTTAIIAGWKLIMVFFVAVATRIKQLWAVVKGWFGKKEQPETGAPADTVTPE